MDNVYAYNAHYNIYHDLCFIFKGEMASNMLMKFNPMKDLHRMPTWHLRGTFKDKITALFISAVCS